MQYKYGHFSEDQISSTKTSMRKQIFFLLLCVDRDTKDEYADIDVNVVFDSTLTRFAGLNELLSHPKEMISIMSLLESARLEYNSPSFKFPKYRKLLLDAGNEVLRIGGTNVPNISN